MDGRGEVYAIFPSRGSTNACLRGAAVYTRRPEGSFAIGSACRGSEDNMAVLQLMSLLWIFNASQPAQSVLTARAPSAEFPAPASATNGFTIEFTADLNACSGDKEVLQIPTVLSVRLRQNPNDRGYQNYPAFKMPDGSVPVLEATLTLHSAEHPEWRNMTIGVPLAELKQPYGQHEVVLNFSGVRWTMYVDGELLDNDFPFGYPQWTEHNTWELNSALVSKASFFTPAISPEATKAGASRIAAVQYWTPPGHNTWVGDVATIFHQGRYHVFYLFDRRHHQSKFGRGAHYFEHISTDDFRTWTEHEAATPLEEQWECIGTGLPFVFNGQLCVSYGLHTTRIYPQEKTTLPAQWECLRKNGRTDGFRRETAPGVPAGATYAVSEDGIAKFKKSWIMFHPCENPSVYVAPSGKLQMLANSRSNGIWESESMDGGWHCINPGFPPGGDCTFFFHWGKFDYIVGGFTGLWSKPAEAPNSAYASMVAKGLDFYDGSNVPSVSEIPGGRFLMAAWIPIRGWGGSLVIRELIQFPDGRIGSMWMPEVLPISEPGQSLAAKVSEPTAFPVDGRPILLTFEVCPAELKKGRLGIAFLPESGEQKSAEFQLRLEARRAQFGPGSLTKFGEIQKSLREGGAPHSAGDYAIENLIGVEQPFTVRMIVKTDAKLGGSLIDAEIAGARTMITYRPDLAVKKLLFRPEGVELRNLRLAPLRD